MPITRKQTVFSFAHFAAILALLASVALSGCAGLVAVPSTTGNPPPPANLTISNVQAISPTATSIQIDWTTNVAASSAVDFGTSAAYGSATPTDSNMVTSHQVTLYGFDKQPGEKRRI